MADLVASPLGPDVGFNWVYLVDLLVCGILALFFLFYFNRLFATLVSYGIRAYTWHKYRAYIDITALQISLLGGRIFFKTVRYHAHNITVLVHDGHITWRYWLRQVQQAEVFDAVQHETLKEKLQESDADTVEAGGTEKQELPCRISVKVSGVEAFIYNRSPSYDGIVEATIRRARQATQAQSGDSTSETAASEEKTKEKIERVQTSSTQPSDPLGKVPQWLHVLPVELQCKRAAAAVGNENTTSVLTAKVEQTVGRIDAAAARATDLYKLLFDFEFKNVTVAMRPNKDYKSPQANTAHIALRKELEEADLPKPGFAARLKRLLPRFLTQKRSTASLRTASVVSGAAHSFQHLPDSVPGQAQWHGLRRYLTDETPDERAEWRGVEYAKAASLADCPRVNMRFYYDIPGIVAAAEDETTSLLGDAGASPPDPDYGLDLAVHGGFVVYGPWADRERIILQKVFFPMTYVDAFPKEPPKVGEARIATVFKLFLSIEEDVTLRIPTREASKDPRWKGRANNAFGQRPNTTGGQSGKKKRNSKAQTPGAPNADIRPYGWLDITVKPNATINYTMDMYARKSGFCNKIDLDVKHTEITSSVNHDLLWRTGALTLHGNLSNPLAWNSLRDWPFKIICDDLELFILRDHMFLIIDLVNDWGSGAPPDFYTFIPMRYNMDITFRNFTMYLNTNDANIINNPADMEANDFLTLEGDTLHGVLGIPLISFRPKKNEITFDVDAHNLSMRMLSSTRNTVRYLLPEKRLARLPYLTLLGCFESNQEQIKGRTDTLRMDIQGCGFSMQAHGFFLRHLINIKENYFGDFVHFKTLEEFQHAGDSIAEANEQTATVPKPKSIVELDVMLSIVVKDATVMLPTNLYSAKEFLKAEVPQALVDLRVGSYYLDLAINLSPISIGMGADGDRSAGVNTSTTQLYVNHTNVYGHRAFGLPPNDAPYACTWDIDVGAITGEMQERFLRDGVAAAKALIFTFQDAENALPLDSPLIVFDATFVQVRTEPVRAWLHLGDEALLLSTGAVSVNTNDWSSELFSQHVNVLVPDLTLACVDVHEVSRHEYSQKHMAKTYAFFQTTVSLNVMGRKEAFSDDARRQQAFIRRNDLRTGRVPFLKRRGPFWADPDDMLDSVDSAAMQFPSFPAHVDKNGDTMHRPASIKSVRMDSLKPLTTKKSSASLASSIRRGRLAVPGISDHGRSPSSTTQYSARSKQSTVASSNHDAEHKPGMPLSMTFTSPYAKPHFVLDCLVLDESVAPSYILASENNLVSSESTSSLEPDEVFVEDDVAQTTISINLVPGIRMFAEPMVGKIAARLMRIIQPTSPEGVMDEFQMDVLSDVVEKNRKKRLLSKVTQVGIALPSLVARVMQPGVSEPVVCDLSLESLRFLTRIRTPSEQVAEGTMSFHVLLSNMTAALHNSAQHTASPAFKLAFDDLMIWVALAKARNMRVAMASMTLDVLAKAAPMFAALPQIVVPLVGEMQETFTKLSEQSHSRLQLLLYQLTQLGEHVSDPPFLTKMTFILRAFPTHFRNQESWKVLMRFRSIMQAVPANVLRDLEHTMASDHISCPENAAAKMLESWMQWRNWDVINIGQTAAFSRILEQPEVHEARDELPPPTSLTWAQDSLRITIQDLDHDSFLGISGLSCGIEVEPPRLPTGLMLVEENKRTRILSHVHASSVDIELQWSLVNIVEAILPNVLQSLPQSQDVVVKRSTTQALEDEIIRQEFHIVVTTDTGNVSLRTINLHHDAHADGLRLSLIGTTQAEEPWGVAASALLNANTTGTELYAGKRKIWESLLTSPSIYIDHLRPRKGAEMPPTVNLAIAYNEVKVNVMEQLPGILRIVDAVIAEEVAQIVHLKETIDQQQVDSTYTLQVIQQSLSSSNRATKVHVALLAGQLLIEVSLLQSLKYRLAGTAASMRLAPSLTEDSLLTIDFETGQLQHSLVNLSRSEQHEQRVVDVPPVNGHVVMSGAQDARKVSVLTTIGRLEIDAEALQAVATTLNKPEVQGVITAIRDGVEDIQERVKDVVPANTKSPDSPQASSPPLEYGVRISLAGIRVVASTPQAPGRAAAAFELGIGACNAVISNEKSMRLDSSPWIPQVRGTIRNIGAKLVVKDQKTVYPAGNITLTLAVQLSVSKTTSGQVVRELLIRSQKFEVNVYPETAAITVDVINQLQDRLKHLDLSGEVEYLRGLRNRNATKIRTEESLTVLPPLTPVISSSELLSMKLKVNLTDVDITWLVHADDTKAEDLALTLAAIELNANGLEDGKLTIRDMQLQLVERGKSKTKRTLNSALLPEVVFSLASWSEDYGRHFAFKASGKPLDLRLDSRFVVPFNGVKKSIDYAVEKFKAGTANWQSIPTSSGLPRESIFNNKHFASLRAEADFAGAQVYLQGSMSEEQGLSTYAAAAQSRGVQHGRYGQFAADDGVVQTTLKSPGISLKLQYENKQTSTVQAELMIAPSSNMLLPTVVPLVLEISKSIKDVMQTEPSKPTEPLRPAQSTFFDEALATADPSAIFGKTKVNLGLRVARQEFALTCQPIAKIDAKAELDDFYLTVSTIETTETGHFFAVSASLSKLSAKVKHLYSREPTFSFDMDSVVLSLMNSKHFSGVNGIAAILKINPTRTSINGKQLQDLLLFREIWLPPEIRGESTTSAQASNDVLMQKYQLVASAAAFPWHATVAISELTIDLDLGQGLGKSSFRITDLWASSQKTSNSEQNLCIGLEEMAMYSQGRMSGFINMSKLAVRTLIQWPEQTDYKTPRIQASIGFGRVRAKAAFDYQAFAFGDIEGLDFLMYNVREKHKQADRLVAVLDCAKIYVFCTSTSPAQAFSLYQAVDRLIQEKQLAFAQSLKEIEKHMRRESLAMPVRQKDIIAMQNEDSKAEDVSSITLHTDVVVSLGKICVGAFPGTFFDSQMFKIEADNLQAQFAVGLEHHKIRSGLGMTIGQLQVALAAVKKVPMPTNISDLGVDEVINAAVDSRGGVILKVPKVLASMETWQVPRSTQIEYIFRSKFDGGVSIGWNLSRINLIRGMWNTHSRALASRMGKPLPESAVKITADLEEKKQNKITAEVNLPQSKYEYIALEPPIIETPQLRDMGEATPPLEWIGLNRDRLPNVTHQVVIVALLGVAKEVEDAYSRILGSS